LLIIDVGVEPDATVGQIQLFKDQHPTARVAVLAERFHQDDMISAFRAGANVYFIKAANCTVFIKALELVMLGETILPAEFLSLFREHEHLDLAPDPEANLNASLEVDDDHARRLSAREKCILRCLAEGSSNKLIARKIDIAEATVKVHVKAILRKIGVHNRTQAAIWAMNNGSGIWSKEVGLAGAPPTSPLAVVSKMQFGPVPPPAASHRRNGPIVVKLSRKTT
jgi:two-component system nitrate/nitrite response regulator NarL